MKIRTLLSIAFFFCFVGTSFSSLVDEKGYPSKALLEIFRELRPLLKTSKVLPLKKIEEILDPQTPPSQVSWKDLADLAQDKLKRPDGVERQDLEGTPFGQQFSPDQQDTFWPFFKKLGFIDSIDPPQKSFSYILINGAMIPAMRKRVQTLIHLVQQEKIALTPETQIVFLTGARDLSDKEKLEDPNGTLKTEYDAAQWVWRQTELPPALIKARENIIFVNAPKKRGKDCFGKEVLLRPDTRGTIQAWIKEKAPKPGPCLSISNQPYVLYQEAVICAALKEEKQVGFTVEGVGEEASTKTSLPILMDTLAQTILYLLENRL